MSADLSSKVIRCLSLNIGELDWLPALKLHADGTVPTQWAAIGFDTNALKQLRRFPAGIRNTILTFLQRESVPIVLPAQAVQEFWNNHGVFSRDVTSLAQETRRLAERYDRLEGSKNSRNAFLDLTSRLNDMAGEIEDAENPHLLRDSIALWELLLPESQISQMPRDRLIEIGEARYATAIAPGFADDKKRSNRLGDFFIWADFLMGLLTLELPVGEQINASVVFVTDDSKEDWRASGAPHPTLLGEVFELTHRPLILMSMNELQKRASE